ncbi:unnamed protein product [Prunus armeniaca]
MPATPCCWATSTLQDESRLVDNGGSGAPWTGRSEGCARPGRSPRSPSDRSPFRRQESRRGRALGTKDTAEQGTPGTATRSSRLSRRKICSRKSRCLCFLGARVNALANGSVLAILAAPLSSGK